MTIRIGHDMSWLLFSFQTKPMKKRWMPTRGTGVQRLLSVLGIDESEAMACGDAVNDVEMLKLVAKGVAMGISDWRNSLGGYWGVRCFWPFLDFTNSSGWAYPFFLTTWFSSVKRRWDFHCTSCCRCGRCSAHGGWGGRSHWALCIVRRAVFKHWLRCVDAFLSLVANVKSHWIQALQKVHVE